MFKIATIGSIKQGKATLIFNQDNKTQKYYKCLKSYAPIVGEKVLITEISGTYVIIGGIKA